MSARARTMLERGAGADRQLKVWRETRDLTKVVDYMISETEAGLFEDANEFAAP